ncbi:MarR family transcriptional regulator [Bdellovibrionota bacterium FG-1]
MEPEVVQLVRMSLAFHNLNKSAENKLSLSLVQYHLLATLRDMPGCSPQKLADAVGMHPSTLTQSLKRLLRKGAIFIGEDPKDSRKRILGMTRTGSELLYHFSQGIQGLLRSQEVRERFKGLESKTEIAPGPSSLIAESS